MSITISKVSKHFGAFAALDGVDLEIPHGTLVALLGPSGSGKTTLLRIIAGLEQPDAGGQVLFSGKDATGRSPKERRVGFVFQHYALFRHMSVAENVAFGLDVRPRATRPSKNAIKERVTELLKLVQLENTADRLPSQLSGGQRQRVALARALAVEPEVLLLDEPFGALDAQVRKDLRRWLRRLHDQVGITSVFVTHDQEEALEVADRIVVFNRGRIEQMGTPSEVYEHPANPFVHRFLGSINIFHGRMQDGNLHVDGLAVPGKTGAGQGVALVRPHDVSVSRERDERHAIAAQVAHISALGPLVHVELERGDGTGAVEAHLPRDRARQLALTPGDQVFLGFADYHVYDHAAAAGVNDYQI